MENDSNTPQGTEVVEPTQTDNGIPDYVFFDPDEDTEEAQPEPTSDEGASTDEEPETEEAEPVEASEEVSETAETEEAEEEAETATPAEAFELPDGTKVDRDELVKGYQRQADYTRKSTEVADHRKALEAEARRINGITEAFITELSKMVPPAPNPALAQTDPNRYTREKAMHESAVAQVQGLVQLGEQAKAANEGINNANKTRTVAEENRMLAEKFPATANQKGRQEFFNEASQAAQAVGFSLDELGGVTDHRMFALAHYAQLGMKAQESKAKATKKAAKAPPATPNKPSANAKANAARKNREAMNKLIKTGSIHDAMKIDIDFG